MKLHPMENKEGLYCFYCPGCECLHVVNTKEGNEWRPGACWPVWQLTGTLDKPTVRASIRVQAEFICHSYITDGKIQFLPDSTHKLSGQTIELSDNLDGELEA